MAHRTFRPPEAAARGKERTVLAGVDTRKDSSLFDIEMHELRALAEAAGAEVVAELVQRRAKADPASLLGLGKVEELKALLNESKATTVVTLNALRPRQRAALESALGDVKVLDRSVLILDIFAAHARTSEGKLQVEMAQLRHRVANLIGGSDRLSRLGGGIGTRGPGETKLEVDRRRMRLRISRLTRELDQVRVRRREQRRGRAETPVVALVGYTNAGKSSLLNALSGAHVYVADQPFATLDPTLRKTRLVSGVDVILADTVGFITDLPKELMAAFRATLDEVTSAALLLHVIDASNPDRSRQQASVETVLAQLGADTLPSIEVWNKIDAVSQPDSQVLVDSPGVTVSAKTGAGVGALKSVIAERLRSLSVPLSSGA
ncbi:MAG: GTPase HflX [Candidatus Eremiobacter antarcticus]|nr:MAG: GTPase HflX [Candidatus Eremiobacter sp. RRmetagenome_bin22]